MKTESTSQKIVSGISVFIVLGTLTALHNRYRIGGAFWARVSIEAIIAGTAIILTIFIINYLYRRNQS